MHSSSITLPVSSLQRAVFINLLKNLCSYGNHFSLGVPLNLSVRLFDILFCLSESYLELLVISLLKTLQCLPISLRASQCQVWILNHDLCWADIPTTSLTLPPPYPPFHWPPCCTLIMSTIFSFRIVYLLFYWPEVLLPSNIWGLPLHFLQIFYWEKPFLTTLSNVGHTTPCQSLPSLPPLCFVSLHRIHHELTYFIFIHWLSPPLQCKLHWKWTLVSSLLYLWHKVAPIITLMLNDYMLGKKNWLEKPVMV